MITALVHGNELCGAWALVGLLKAGVRPAAGRLTLAFCNLAAFDHFDAADHDASRFVEEDMNRQWSTERLSEPDTVERRRAAALAPFVRQADWLLDLHSMHEPSAPLSLTGLSWNNVALAAKMRAPAHIVIDAGHSEGIRMRDFGPFAPQMADTTGARSLLVECGYHGDPGSRDVAQDQCLRFLEQALVLDVDGHDRIASWRMPDAIEQWILEVTGAVVAKSEHFRFVEPYRGLEIIAQAGTVIAHDDRPILTPYDDCALVMPSTRHARAGVTVVRFATCRAANSCLV